MAVDYTPASDVAVGSWKNNSGGTTNLFQAIDEVNFNDADFVQSSLSPATVDAYETKFPVITDPGVDTGHTVTYRIGKSASGGDRIDMSVKLKQGSTVIAAWQHLDVANGYQTVVQSINSAQVATITNYSDLRLRFEVLKFVAGTPGAGGSRLDGIYYGLAPDIGAIQ